jgi:hypothetical protein
MSAFEGAQYGVGDFVLLENITTDAFMSNLKLRFEKSKIYTYIGGMFCMIHENMSLHLTYFFYLQRSLYLSIHIVNLIFMEMII